LVVAAGNDQGLYGFAVADGSHRWLLPTGGAIRSSPAIVGSEVYAASGRSIYAVDAADGSPRWSFPTGGEVTSSPTVVDAVLYVGGHDGFLYAIEGDGRRPLAAVADETRSETEPGQSAAPGAPRVQN
jgi:outer membrane protein assembly factor BamB